MYLEFRLPTGAGGMAAQYTYGALRRNIREWANRYQVEKYQEKVVKYTVRLTFDDESLYSLFAMTWSPTAEQMLSYLKNYKLIEPMARPE